MTNRLCDCGSGLEKERIYDAAGIYLTSVCRKCRHEKIAQYNPAIFKAGTQYAITGDEDQIGIEDDYNVN